VFGDTRLLWRCNCYNLVLLFLLSHFVTKRAVAIRSARAFCPRLDCRSQWRNDCEMIQRDSSGIEAIAAKIYLYLGYILQTEVIAPFVR
ncbi:MAG: hypothetical protein ACFCBU_16885, partial [Cyanophyceae cyanobacterium]